MNIYIRCKVWDEITYPSPNFIEVWEWISNIHPSLSYLSTPESNLFHVSRWGPGILNKNTTLDHLDLMQFNTTQYCLKYAVAIGELTFS